MGMPKYSDLATFIVSRARKGMAFAICSMFLRELVVDVFIFPLKKCPTNKKGITKPIKNIRKYNFIVLKNRVFTISNKISIGNF